MGNQLTRLHVKNFRSLADVSIETRPINVLFGPNGSGKSTLLEAIRLVKDCVSRDVDEAIRTRHNGFGMLRQGSAAMSIRLEAAHAEYELQLGFSRGQIEPYAGEVLYSKAEKASLIHRIIGSDEANFYHDKEKPAVQTRLTFPEKLALIQYMQGSGFAHMDASNLQNLLNSVYFYHSHYIDLYGLKHRGSESGINSTLREDCGNLWSVLRNIHGKGAIDSRYATIISFMQNSFPTFKDIVFDSAGPNGVYASFVEKSCRDLIPALSVSDGHLQMLIHLTALFSEGEGHESLILFDEPETSLHPYAISVFAEAVHHATKKWNKQVFIATHSPVLIGQFEPEEILATKLDESGQTVLTRVSEMEDIKDLLESYDTGSLYMAEAIAPQSKPYTKEKGE
jgi:predicted ATPase